MNYYAVLEMTNSLIAQHRWVLQRCRRRCDGPARYIVLNEKNAQLIADPHYKSRRLGFTLQELLLWLCEHGDEEIAGPAADLLQQLNNLIEQ
jgi:hypothetical protein